MTQLNHKSEKQTASSSLSPEEKLKRIDTLFMRFAAIYGQLWLVVYQDETILQFAKQQWSFSLEDFDNKILKLALNKIIKTQLFPPTLPLFIECCEAIKKGVQGQQERTTFKPEPYIQPDPNIVKSNIKQMKSYLVK